MRLVLGKSPSKRGYAEIQRNHHPTTEFGKLPTNDFDQAILKLPFSFRRSSFILEMKLLGYHIQQTTAQNKVFRLEIFKSYASFQYLLILIVKWNIVSSAEILLILLLLRGTR
jgi:hypothetical protein